MDTFIQRIPLSLRAPSWRRTQFARRLLAIVLFVIAAALFVGERLGATHRYVVVTAELVPGSIIKAEHLASTSLPQKLEFSSGVLVPEDAVGRVVATPLRPGDFLQEHHLLGPELSAAFGAGADTLVPIKLVDPAAAELAIPGAQVSVVSAPSSAEATTIAEGARVIFGTARKTDSTEAGTVLLAMDKPSAERVAAASLGTALTVVLTPLA
ncbi:hypothetical protein CKALI_08345 [Corynebacterium kalinowskii]|uniref:SAF domain-containing protein n=1 Tax=Corynebacterium kalinowskii TaxID=2675216 RepID=A0A6B8VHP2_9CORY|nr:SAF domain-containing protein [Corynebacterium kalinowskii]QGU02529.1 hypothetical protein CKALI_08345 [Corynebacterium kalinowskii]